MEDEKKEVSVPENQEPDKATTTEPKKSFKEKLAMRKQAKKDDKIRVLEIKADLMKNPENPDDRKKQLKEIRKRQLKRVAVPAAIVAGATVGAIVTVVRASGGSDDSTNTSEESVPTE